MADFSGPEPLRAGRDDTRLRIGILTFHRCINYGSFWQARCLAEGLRALGHDAVLLDHDSDEVTRAEWRCALQPLLPRRSSRADIRAHACKVRRFQAAFETLPLSAPFQLSDPGAMADCDLVVVGSDEVWNFRHPWYAGRRLFFGEGLRAPRVVSYAASFGNHDAEHGIGPEWSALLREFAAISVRDANSQRLVADALGTAPPLVLDPCLQFPPDLPADASGERIVAVYGHGFADGFGAAVRRWADARGERLVSIGYRNHFAHEQWLDADPFDFAAAMLGARAVVTNFFHGCVFAVLGGKPFVAAATPYRRNKVRDLMDALGAGRHLVTDEADEAALAAVLDGAPGPAIPGNLARLRRESDTFLRSVLG